MTLKNQTMYRFTHPPPSRAQKNKKIRLYTDQGVGRGRVYELKTVRIQDTVRTPECTNSRLPDRGVIRINE